VRPLAILYLAGMNLTATAFLFDLNGTLIDDMPYHTQAWHGILNNDLQHFIPIEAVKQEMYGKNEEVLARIFGAGFFPPERVQEISLEKERRYQQAYLPELRLLPGLQAFLDAAKAQGIRMAIGTAAIPFNVRFVTDHLHLDAYFPVVVTADDVAESKPHPATFLRCAELLGVDPADCVVFEDTPKGVESARNAGMRAVVLLTTHEADEFAAYDNVVAMVKDYHELKVEGVG
jgi:beta-phosphoglucomutase